MSKKLAGKVAVITGGNSGIGLATARRFLAEGAHVFITGRRQAELEEAVRQIGRNVTGVQGDVSNLADLDRLFASVKQQQGRLDVLFANAGVPALAPLGEITEEHFDKAFAINVKGLLFTVQKALPLFTAGGSIILNASIVASKGLESISVYSATKAAVRSFARCWTTDLRHRQIRVNVISPGYTETLIFSKAGLRSQSMSSRWVSPPPCRWAGCAGRTRSPMPPCSSRRTKAATSPAPSCSSMAAWPRYKLKSRRRGRDRPGSPGRRRWCERKN
jgi:NAD(P)-dependent dehydrogenase (short-subunit alcohol dehydrogenase family)